MKISAINTAYTQQFSGQNNGTKKSSGVKTAAGAAMIALATTIPAQETDAQIRPPMPPHQYYIPAPVMNVPNCFIYGDITCENYEKTLPDVFSEIDAAIAENGEISVNEVVTLEENNWNATHLYPMSREQKVNTANLVKNLSKKYNQKGSNPNTINYDEYANIMKYYMRSQNTANLLDLLQIIATPIHGHPHGPHHHGH